MRRILHHRLLADAALLLIALVFVLPLSWLLMAAFDPRATNRAQLPRSVSLENFGEVLNPTIFFQPLANSLLIATGTALLTTAIAVLAAYPLSRYPSPAGRRFLLGILFGTSIPITAVMVPVYGLFVQLELLDNPPAVVLFLSATGLPISIWMAKNFTDAVPLEVEEAVWMDGATRLRGLVSVVIPLMRPGLAVVFIFSFIDTWGNFFTPFVLLLSAENQPLSVTIYSFFGLNGAIRYGQLAAFSVLYAAPVLGLYLIVSRAIGGSFALSGAVKG